MKFHPFCMILFCLLVVNSAAGQFRNALIEEAKPWSREPQIDGSNYSFVIFADRTGGEERGVFDKAIALANGMKYDFAISVGDLIDGYTFDTTYSAKQWAAFDGDVRSLHAPFFYVSGNHDVTNSVLSGDWNRRFGRTYYHFFVNNDLFLVLDTEEPDGRGNLISDIQAKYFSELIKQHQGGHIYLFMHRPLWSPAPSKGYQSIDASLSGRQFTLFSGHEHSYYMENRNGNKHYVLATTGGGSDLRGVRMGEFYHIMKVDVSGDGAPRVSNILLDGTQVSDSVVNNRTWPMVNALKTDGTIVVKPVVANNSQQNSFHTTLLVKNTQNVPLYIDIKTAKMAGVKVKLGHESGEVAAHSEMTIPVTITHTKVDMDQIPPISVEVRRGYEMDGELVTTTSKRNVTLDYKRHLTESNSVSVKCTNPAYVKEEWDWKGVDDGHFEFTLSRDATHLYMKLRSYDDKLITVSDDSKALQDGFIVALSDPTSLDGSLEYVFVANGSRSDVTTDGNSIVVTTSFPIEQFGKAIKLNVGFVDIDAATNSKPSILWWRPIAGSAADYPEAGVIWLDR